MTLEIKKFTTRGDQKLDLNLLQKSEAGGKGLFTRELEEALLAGEIDVAVHSLKDLPGHNPAGLEITAVLERAATADVLISRDASEFSELPDGAIVGTSSVRRACQLRWLRPDIEIVEWRGNVQTRLRKLVESGTTAGIILAQAGLARLGFAVESGMLQFEGADLRVASLAEQLLPAIGQGAIALQCVAGRAEVTEVLGAVNHEPTMICVRAERELQRLLSGDCSIPIGVRTLLRGDSLEMEAILFGKTEQPPMEARSVGTADDPEGLAGKIFAALSTSQG